MDTSKLRRRIRMRVTKEKENLRATIAQYDNVATLVDAAVITDCDIEEGKFSFLGQDDANGIELYFDITLFLTSGSQYIDNKKY